MRRYAIIKMIFIVIIIDLSENIENDMDGA